ncbi:hypothetical protein PPEP_b1031 [Pseudoalteromonas peptidolytica F12-50-A1]|uniref:Uncharacterized protein n=1 Tax=Pseudoalteromonas peptidolytica F12-50-A1 TaxID=1315280 RepID=A0A8I0N214_9GAMM|nr:hypothetical protein [Pseudoalteromonas peptidolytica F12-50-A1]
MYFTPIVRTLRVAIACVRLPYILSHPLRHQSQFVVHTTNKETAS